MSEFSDLISSGMAELTAQAGVRLRVTAWRVDIPAVQGAGISFDSVVDGGLLDNENPSFTIRKSDLPAGKKFAQGMKVCLDGKTFKIRNVSFDPADPCVRITTEGEDQ